MKNPLASLSEPVRLYGALVAALSLVAHYHPDIPTALILALLAAVLGVGETVRNTVTPEAHITTVEDPEQAFDLLTRDSENTWVVDPEAGRWADDGGPEA